VNLGGGGSGAGLNSGGNTTLLNRRLPARQKVLGHALRGDEPQMKREPLSSLHGAPRESHPRKTGRWGRERLYTHSDRDERPKQRKAGSSGHWTVASTLRSLEFARTVKFRDNEKLGIKVLARPRGGLLEDDGD